MIYKIVRRDDWEAARKSGRFLGAAVDLQDGYIHFSTATQLKETAAKHFSGQDDLYLVAVNESVLGDALTWEPSRGGQLFPHLYAPLPYTAVEWEVELPCSAATDRSHDFPEDLLEQDRSQL